MAQDIENARQEAYRDAVARAPRESCGLFVEVNHEVIYWACRNLAADSPEGPSVNFLLDPSDYAAAAAAGTVRAVVHSHPAGFPTPSQADLAACELWGLEWHIVSPHLGDGSGLWYQFRPTGFRAPLLGREWVWGVHDCFALVRDWFSDHGLTIPDFERPDIEAFQENPLFLSKYPEAGFAPIAAEEKIQPGDCALMSIGRSKGLNHVGVFTSNLRLLHHLQGRLSGADFYGEGLRKCTGVIIRHLACQNLRIP